MIEIKTEEEFNDLPWDNNILVLFTAPAWCVPCQRFEPHWERAQSTEALEHIIFVKIDMGASPEDTGGHWATKRFGIMGVPQLKLWPVGSTESVDIKSRAIIPLIRELLA